MSTLIPHEHMPLAEWWSLWKSGVFCGYGGARAPEEPRPIQVPSETPSTDYRKEICEAIESSQTLAREIAAERAQRAEPKVPTIGLRHGTGVEAIPNGTLHILELITELMIEFRAFYRRFCQLGRPILCNDAYLLGMASRVVRLRLLLVAVRAQEHVDEMIDEYIVRCVTPLL